VLLVTGDFIVKVGPEILNTKLGSERALFRGYHTAVFISTRISRSSVDYQPEATAEG